MRNRCVFGTALLAASLAFAGDAAEEWAALQKEYEAAQQEFYRPFREAKSDAERSKIRVDWSKNPQTTFLPKFREFAAKHAGTEEAIPALVMLLRNSTSQEEAAEATQAIVSSHAASPAIADAVLALRDTEALRTVLAKNRDRTVLARATFRLAEQLKSSSPGEAFLLYQKGAKEYADVPLYGSRTVGAACEGAIFETKHLSVGKRAPDIEGTDFDGVPFRLSDYKGKVILLDFWGDW